MYLRDPDVNNCERIELSSVRQPDAICRAIGPAITYFSSMRSVIGPHFLNRVMYRETARAPPLCTESAGLGAAARGYG